MGREGEGGRRGVAWLERAEQDVGVAVGMVTDDTQRHTSFSPLIKKNKNKNRDTQRQPAKFLSDFILVTIRYFAKTQHKNYQTKREAAIIIWKLNITMVTWHNYGNVKKKHLEKWYESRIHIQISFKFPSSLLSLLDNNDS